MFVNIVIVDNFAIIRDGLKLLLESETDFKVVGSAGNGFEAVNLVRELSPEIVLMDISMPELNGIEATSRIKAEFPEINVIMLSILGDSESIFRALKAGANGYLLKESVGQEVISAIRSVLAGHRYLSQKVDETVIDAYLNEKMEKNIESPLELLSQREREVLQLVAEGNGSKEIAEKLFISPKTVETYRSRIMKKLNLKDITALVRFALRHNIIEN